MYQLREKNLSDIVAIYGRGQGFSDHPHSADLRNVSTCPTV